MCATVTRTSASQNQRLTLTPRYAAPYSPIDTASAGSSHERCDSTRRRISGPTSAPAPRAANSRPVPAAPTWNTTVASSGNAVSTPLPSPTADFTVTSAPTRGRCATYRSASAIACQVRAGGPERTACIGRRIGHTRAAAPARQAAVTRKQTYGPTAAASTPPSEAPSTSIVPQAEPASALAAARSSGSTRLGSAADAAGV